MAGRRDLLIQRRARWGVVARALGTSLALHLVVIVGAGTLATRNQRAPRVQAMDPRETVEVTPIEMPVAAATPGQPAISLPPQTNLPATPPATGTPGTPGMPASESRRRSPLPPLAQEKSPRAAEPTTRTTTSDEEEAPALPAAAAKVESTQVPARALPPPVAVAPPAPPAPKATATARKIEPPPVEIPAIPATAPAPNAADAGAGETAIVSAPGPAPGPSWGVVGVAPAGGSPLGLFVGLLNEKLRDQWRAKEVYQRVDPRGRLEGSMYSTILDVRIRADGSLERITVHAPSGIPELDAEALDAFRRARPLPRPPTEVVDGQGGYALQFGFHLDVAVFHFRKQVERAIMEDWRGSPAFRQAGDRPRTTKARMLLTKEGALVHILVLTSAGLELLDEGVRKALQPGKRFPPPPPAFVRRPGLIPVDLEFLHNVRAPSNVHTLRPGEGQENRPETK